MFSIAVLPHSPGVVYYHLLLRRETRIPGVAPFSFRIGFWDLFVHRVQKSYTPTAFGKLWTTPGVRCMKHASSKSMTPVLSRGVVTSHNTFPIWMHAYLMTIISILVNVHLKYHPLLWQLAIPTQIYRYMCTPSHSLVAKRRTHIPPFCDHTSCKVAPLDHQGAAAETGRRIPECTIIICKCAWVKGKKRDGRNERKLIDVSVLMN